MIDLHSHILPGVDDGSRDISMTAQMLSEMKRQGTQAVVATPHFYPSHDQPDAFLERRARAMQALAAIQEDHPRVIPGAEVAFFDGISRSVIPELLRIENTELLLIEMPFTPWTERAIRELCDFKMQTGITPVLAHVNRYLKTNQLPAYRELLLDSGVLFQCNAEAFLRFRTRGWALRELRSGGIHFLGSDAHNLTSRAPNLARAAQVITRKLGTELLEQRTAFANEMLNV